MQLITYLLQMQKGPQMRKASCLRSVMALQGNMNSMMEPYEKRLEKMTDAPSAHAVFIVAPYASLAEELTDDHLPQLQSSSQTKLKHSWPESPIFSRGLVPVQPH